MKDAQDRIRQAGEVFIQKGRYPKLLRHEGLLVERPDLVMRLPLVDAHPVSAGTRVKGIWEIRVRAAA
jgi:hypothetical protein